MRCWSSVGIILPPLWSLPRQIYLFDSGERGRGTWWREWEWQWLERHRGTLTSSYYYYSAITIWQIRLVGHQNKVQSHTVKRPLSERILSAARPRCQHQPKSNPIRYHSIILTSSTLSFCSFCSFWAITSSTTAVSRHLPHRVTMYLL